MGKWARKKEETKNLASNNKKRMPINFWFRRSWQTAGSVDIDPVQITRDLVIFPFKSIFPLSLRHSRDSLARTREQKKSIMKSSLCRNILNAVKILIERCCWNLITKHKNPVFSNKRDHKAANKTILTRGVEDGWKDKRVCHPDNFSRQVVIYFLGLSVRPQKPKKLKFEGRSKWRFLAKTNWWHD